MNNLIEIMKLNIRDENDVEVASVVLEYDANAVADKRYAVAIYYAEDTKKYFAVAIYYAEDTKKYFSDRAEAISEFKKTAIDYI